MIFTNELRKIWAGGIVLVCLLTVPASADSMRLALQPGDPGPFPPDVGGFMDFTVALEMFDSEGDGVDTQGNATAVFHILTDTGLAIPPLFPALTGESGIYGPARVDDYRHSLFDAPEPQFVGGYGYAYQQVFGGAPSGDDRLGVGGLLEIWWFADGQPSAPGLQPLAMAGVGYGERPAGGDWLFAEGQIPIPTAPGLYTVEVVPTNGAYILPDVDLTIDQEQYRGALDAAHMLGGSLSFTVLPEPGTILLSLMGTAVIGARRHRGHRGV